MEIPKTLNPNVTAFFFSGGGGDSRLVRPNTRHRTTQTPNLENIGRPRPYACRTMRACALVNKHLGSFKEPIPTILFYSTFKP